MRRCSGLTYTADYSSFGENTYMYVFDSLPSYFYHSSLQEPKCNSCKMWMYTSEFCETYCMHKVTGSPIVLTFLPDDTLQLMYSTVKIKKVKGTELIALQRHFTLMVLVVWVMIDPWYLHVVHNTMLPWLYVLYSTVAALSTTGQDSDRYIIGLPDLLSIHGSYSV